MDIEIPRTWAKVIRAYAEISQEDMREFTVK